MVNKLLIAGTVVTLAIFAYWYITPYNTSEAVMDDGYDYVQCPTEDNFEMVWNIWSYEYLNANPGVDVDTQMAAWNAEVLGNGCNEEWLNPLDDLIAEQAASSTPVYWEYDAN